MLCGSIPVFTQKGYEPTVQRARCWHAKRMPPENYLERRNEKRSVHHCRGIDSVNEPCPDTYSPSLSLLFSSLHFSLCQLLTVILYTNGGA